MNSFEHILYDTLIEVMDAAWKAADAANAADVAAEESMREAA